MDEYTFLSIGALLTTLAAMQTIRLGLFSEYNQKHWPYYILLVSTIVALWPLWIIGAILLYVYNEIKRYSIR